MTNGIKIFTAMVVSTASLAVVSSADASTYAYAYSGAGAGQADVFQERDGVSGAVSSINYNGSPINFSSVVSSATTTYGVLKAATSGSASNAYGQGAALSTFTDHLVITGATGQSFKVGGSYDLNYNLAPDTRSSGTVKFDASIASGSDFISLSFLKLVQGTNDPTNPFNIYIFSTITSQINGNSNTTNFNPSQTLVLPTLDVASGGDISLFARLDVGGVATSGSYIADAAHSAYWGGLNVSDAAGQPSNSYGLTASSGTDWRNSLIPSPVPEPKSYALFAFGLAAIYLVSRTATRRADA